MGLRTYKATLWWMTVAQKLLGFNLRVSGAESLPDRPTMYVSNHFTRIETFLTPYALFAETRRQVRSLSTHTIFRSWYGRYVELLGGMSLRDPRRNITIVRELMTGSDDWLIYPEGGLVKNKKIIDRGRLQIHRPSRKGPPHTGASMLALKAEICKRRYLDACAKGDDARRAFYEQRYHLSGPEDVCTEGVVVVPVNVTFYPLRPGMNLVSKLARRLISELDPRLEEELQIEGRILLGDIEVIIHFGEPIEVRDYLDAPTRFARKLAGLFSETHGSELALRHQARRLTEDSVRAIYACTEINLDHLFCYGLYALDRDEIEVADFHRALYLAASKLAARPGVRVHQSLRTGMTALVGGAKCRLLNDIVKFVEDAGIVRCVNGKYIVNRDALRDEHDFHQIRLRNPVRVIANEMESVTPAVAELKRSLRLSPSQLRTQTGEALRAGDRGRFDRDHAKWAGPNPDRAKHLGEPFFLDARGSSVGVVLVHGYLGCPEQVRPMAEYLHEKGLSVYGVRLSGHGTSPQQLPHVTWADWMDSVVRGYAAMRQSCDQVVMVGFSLGGVLALLAAARPGLEIDAVVSINAPLRLRDRRMPFVPALLHFNRLQRWMGIGSGYAYRHNPTESPGVNYDHHYLDSVSEVRRASAKCRRKLRQIDCPVLAMHSEEDPLVARSSGRLILSELRSSVKLLTELPFDRHMIVRGPGCEQVYRKVIAFIEQSTVQPGKAADSAAA